MLAVTLVQIACSIAAVWFGARTAMGFGRDARAAVFHRVGDVLVPRGQPLRRTVADHPHHERRAAGADARAADLHADGLGADHVRRRHHHGAARGPRAVLADRGERHGPRRRDRRDRLADGAAVPPDAEAHRRGQPGAARADHRHPGRARVRARAGRASAVRRGQRRPHRHRAARRPAAWRSCSRPCMLVLNVSSVAVLWFGAHRIAAGRDADRLADRVPQLSACRSSCRS